MNTNNYLVELFSDMPTCNIEDCKFSGDLILVPSKDILKMIDHLAKNQVEFTISVVGKCELDLSYRWWE